MVYEAALAVLASPVYAVLAVRRMVKNWRFLRIASKPGIVCECGVYVSLVGIWRCSCRFTYRGHLLTVCPVCRALPCVVRCYRCGVTTKLPEPG